LIAVSVMEAAIFYARR